MISPSRHINALDYYHGKRNKTIDTRSYTCPIVPQNTTLRIFDSQSSLCSETPFTTSPLSVDYLSSTESLNLLPFSREFSFPQRRRWEDNTYLHTSSSFSVDHNGTVSDYRPNESDNKCVVRVDFSSGGLYNITFTREFVFENKTTCRYSEEFHASFSIEACPLKLSTFKFNIVESHYLANANNIDYVSTRAGAVHQGFDPILDDPNILSDVGLDDFSFDPQLGVIILPFGLQIAYADFKDYLSLNFGSFTPGKNFGATVFPDGHLPTLVYNNVPKYSVVKGGIVYTFKDFPGISNSF
jgi:hypothetical protein